MPRIIVKGDVFQLVYLEDFLKIFLEMTSMYTEH